MTPRPVDELSDIFRAINGDRSVYGKVTLEDVENVIYADTFEKFLAVNQMPVFEAVLR